ncbi:hypothetical protein E1212_08925 [Jiangella ureilytica]|uniref:Nuclear transport factor 2 family protein n=1 Tax=Jiangella ureilytica TaxID=2530374 RepID=A0A4R4RRG4_9ACTN|nr:hypothetical protein [Jiangella ureilytica]TDC52430.1 hypothetical protein E1212_08925 [Jiangella ureilytica]
MRVRALAAGVAVSVLAVSIVLAGCEAGGGDEPAGLDGPANTATGSAPSVDDTAPPGPSGEPTDQPAEDWAVEVGGEPPEAAADLAVYEAYLRYWRADLEALSIPDPAHQPFLDATIDPQRQRVVSVAQQLLAQDHRTIGTLRIEPFVVSVSGPAAAVQDCMDGRQTYDVDAAGAEVPDSRGDLIPVLVQLAQEGGRWVVADVQQAEHDCG